LIRILIQINKNRFCYKNNGGRVVDEITLYFLKMITIAELIRRISSVNLRTLTVESIDDTKEDIVVKQREQLFDGKLSTGEDITPSYLDDPYFKSKESAQRYSDWKDKITPNPKRKKGTPNLFINGYYHNNIYVKVGKDEIVYDSDADFSDKVEQKYSKKILGLEDERKSEYTFQNFWPVLKHKLEGITKLSFK
jgi:hypothetical protein